MDEHNTPSTDDRHSKSLALLCSVFAIATCGLIYELLAGTIASYMLGDSVTQFSTIIGVYLFSDGARLIPVSLFSQGSDRRLHPDRDPGWPHWWALLLGFSLWRSPNSTRFG